MQQPEPVKLRRVLNALLGAAIVVGGSIGIGILSIPGIVAGRLGDPLLVIVCWFVGGALALLGANIYAELGTTFPQAGGPYVYLRRAAGPFVGFVTGWADTAVSILEPVLNLMRNERCGGLGRWKRQRREVRLRI